MGHRHRDWSSLPPELLEKISYGLTVNADYIRFRAVCKSWRSASPKMPRENLPCQAPWLMLPDKDDDTIYGGDFFSFSDNKVYYIDLPEARGKRCFGSWQGWLCFVDDNLSIFLLNPITKAQIQLPSITTVPESDVRVSEAGQEEYVWRNRYDDERVIRPNQYVFEHFCVKLILSENPTSKNCIAMIVHSAEYKIAFYRTGDRKWWIPSEDFVRHYLCKDLIYLKGQFYSVDIDLTLTICNADPRDSKVEKIASGNMVNYHRHKKYLVEVCGELLMVIRDYGNYETLWFHVYKFRPRFKDWIRVNNLGDYALFLGMSGSISLLVKDIPSKGYRPNCIYFTDHYEASVVPIKFGGGNIGIFDMEDGTIKPLPCYTKKSDWIWPPVIWITPSLW